MPRLSPARTAEEAASIPADQPVTIELTVPDNQPPPVSADVPPKVVTAGSTTVTAPAPEPAPEPEDNNVLRKQLQELQRAEELSRRQLLEAQRREQEAIRIAIEHVERSANAEAAEEESIYNSVVTTIAAAKADADKAQTDYAVAAEAQDYAAMADAQMRMSNAAALMAQSERDKNDLDRQREAAKRAPKPEPRQQQPQLTVEQHIDRMPNLSPAKRDWLKRHTDALTDSTKYGALGLIHNRAIADGLRDDSDEYFAHMETWLGYRKPETNGSHEPERKGNSMPVSAPVQRAAPSMTNGAPAGPTRIELTPEQREHARIAGVDEVTYAKNVLRLRDLKAQGHYQER